MFKKVIEMSWVYPFIWIHTKSWWGLFWVETQAQQMYPVDNITSLADLIKTKFYDCFWTLGSCVSFINSDWSEKCINETAPFKPFYFDYFLYSS